MTYVYSCPRCRKTADYQLPMIHDAPKCCGAAMAKQVTAPIVFIREAMKAVNEGCAAAHNAWAKSDEVQAKLREPNSGWRVKSQKEVNNED